MEEQQIIATKPHGLDYAALVTEGVTYLKQLCGDMWNDVDPHDPGITMLEYLCYAISDLCYRLNFPLVDLLAAQENSAASKVNQQFFTAREILTTNPVTLDDYRRVLIDLVDELGHRLIRNAWLEPIKTPGPLQGFYRVYLDAIDSIMTEEQMLLLVSAVKKKLAAQRNLCEDFQEIILLRKQPVALKIKVQVAIGSDVNQLAARIYYALQEFLSPTVRFCSLDTLLSQGKPVEDIFIGPALLQGFIDETELKRCQPKKVIYASNLISLIQKIPDVEAIHEITLGETEHTKAPLYLSLSEAIEREDGAIFCLESLDKQLDNIKLTSGEIDYPIDKNSVGHYLEQLNSEAFKKHNIIQDIAVPVGRDRQLERYISIQQDFPDHYGIKNNLPTAVGGSRIAQARQLKGYLLIFDQILADYCAQLSQFKNLLAVNTTDSSFSQTVFHQVVTGVSELDKLLKNPETYLHDLQEINNKNPSRELEHKNRLLDHLLARFNEGFTGDVMLLNQMYFGYEKPEDEKEPTLHSLALQPPIEYKLRFLKNYPLFSCQRGQAFNYLLPHNQSNCSGLEKRIAQMLAVSYDFDPFSQNPMRFYLVEHHLLNLPDEVDRAANLSFKISLIFPKEYQTKESSIIKILNDEVPLHIRYSLYWLNDADGKDEFTEFKNIFESWVTALNDGVPTDLTTAAENLWNWLQQTGK